MPRQLTVCDHPLLQDKLARLRDRSTSPKAFRRLMTESGTILGIEALRSLKTRKASVRTPLASAPGRIEDEPVAVVAVLRAGLGLVPGLLRLVPHAAIGHIGLYRNEETLNPVRYYVRLPKNLREYNVLLCDPMLATGGSACEAISILKNSGARKIALLSVIAAKAGVSRVASHHPDVRVYTAGLDPKLNKEGFIVPGLGDAGDRLFGTLED